MRIVIGKAADCTIRVHNDPYVSPKHCEIAKGADGEWRVRDLGSTNGTYIRKLFPRKITIPTRLNKGDVIIVGRTELPHWDLP